jgi:ribosomal protein L28
MIHAIILHAAAEGNTGKKIQVTGRKTQIPNNKSQTNNKIKNSMAETRRV